jgi:hypothetical protein
MRSDYFFTAAIPAGLPDGRYVLFASTDTDIIDSKDKQESYFYIWSCEYDVADDQIGASTVDSDEIVTINIPPTTDSATYDHKFTGVFSKPSGGSDDWLNAPYSACTVSFSYTSSFDSPPSDFYRLEYGNEIGELSIDAEGVLTAANPHN